MKLGPARHARCRGGHRPITLAVLVAWLLAACQTAPAKAPARLYVLTVAHGQSSGRYAAGEVVHVWAEPPELGWLFDQWVGDIEFVADAQLSHTAVTMPARPLQLTANYRAVPVWTALHDTLAGRPVHYYFPPAPIGVIVYFHGSGSDADEWIESEAEKARFLAPAVAGGFAFIATESQDRDRREWELSAEPDENDDLRTVRAILETFVARGAMAVDAPTYAVGVSQGGRFATLAAQALGFDGTAIFVGVGQPNVLATTNVPTIWCLAQNDPIINLQDAVGHYENLRRRGVATALIVNPPAPLCPQCFRAVEGIDAAESERLFAGLEAEGYVNEAGFLVENPRFSAWEADVAGDYSPAVRHDLKDLMWAAYAEHEFFGECTQQVLRFFTVQR